MSKAGKILLSIFSGVTIVFSLLLFYHQSAHSSDCLDYKNENVSQEEYYRDSLLLLNTMYQFRDSLVHPFDHYAKELDMIMYTDSVSFHLTKIFYSPDKLKFVAMYMIRKINENEGNNSHGKYVYNGSCLIGYRKNVDSLWGIYPFHPYTFENAPDSSMVLLALCDYYFHQMKNDEEYVYDERGKHTSQPYKYNIGDKAFWTSSYIWRKGSKGLPDIYWFEIESTGAISERNLRIRQQHLKGGYPDILTRTGNINYIYPDSILKLYGDPVIK